MLTITKRFTFDAAHRLLGHEGKCKWLHGHTYVAEVTVQGPELDHLGRIIDFGVVKRVLGKWIDQYWDHATLLHPSDPLLPLLTAECQNVFVMPVGRPNPTAENMATELAFVACGLLDELKPPATREHPVPVSWLEVTHVRVYETPSNWADWSI